MKTRTKNAQGNYVEQEKWYGRAAQDGTVEFEDFVTHMSEHNSPYSRGVIHGVLTDMLDHLKEMVLQGKSVRFGDIGLFSIGMSSTPADTRDDWTATKVKGVHLIVRNTKKMEQCRTPQKNLLPRTHRLRRRRNDSRRRRRRGTSGRAIINPLTL